MTIPRTAVEWTWRAAMLAALLWVGAELRQIHEDLLQPPVDVQTAQDSQNAEPDDLQASIEDLQDDVDLLSQKVDAMLIAMAQLKP
jgi:peptidoglycan hydrolase CwlO-like protein